MKAHNSRKLLLRSLVLAVALLVSSLGPVQDSGATTVPGGGGGTAGGTYAYMTYVGRSGSTLLFRFTLNSDVQWRLIGITYYIQRDGGGQPEKHWSAQRTCEPIGSTVSSCSFVVPITDVRGQETYFYTIDPEGNNTLTSDLTGWPNTGIDPHGDTCNDPVYHIDCPLVGKTVVQ